MKKLLISWVSEFSDFDRGNNSQEINYKGPSFDLHHNFFSEHDRHILLSTAPDGDKLGNRLQGDLSRVFSGRSIELIGLDIPDPTNYQEVKAKFDNLMEQWAREASKIDLMFTTGTSIMRIVMVLAHLNPSVPTRLFQGISPKITLERGKFIQLHLKQDEALSRLYLRLGNPRKPSDDFILTESLKPVYLLADKVAQVDKVGVLILGASGSGKEYLAKYIHKNSWRRNKEFIAVNCASLNDDLLQSELFGHKKGSFSNAYENRKGLFEAADGGTIFLDEIGDISPKMQQSLLRVLEQKEVLRLGENKTRKVNVRVIAATNVDLMQKIEEGKFREDLYYRLCGVELYIPSLKEYSSEDLEQLICQLITRKAKEFKREELPLDKEVLKLLKQYSFPGNIRELNQIITHFYIFAKNTISVNDLPPRWKIRQKEEIWTLAQAEKSQIIRILNYHNGNMTHASKTLKISYGKLDRKMKAYGLKD